MPLIDRQRRHQRLLEGVQNEDVHWWRKSFLNALATCDQE
jgi:trehalose 6-phosphate synthase